MLHQTRQAGAGHIDGRTRTLRLGTAVPGSPAIAVRVHVPVLSVFAIAVHGGLLRICGRREPSIIESAFPGVDEFQHNARAPQADPWARWATWDN